MPHKVESNYIHDSPWDNPDKQIARWLTIIRLYQETFHENTIPNDQQYWSLCGAHTKNNKPIKGELGHLLEYGLIQKNQYYGVDREEKIINKNKKSFPDINWIHDDFINAIENYINNKIFNPKIINYDGVMQPKNSTQYLKKILITIDDEVPNELMLVTNFVLWNPYNPSQKLRYEVKDILKYIKKIYSFPKHWEMFPICYKYRCRHSNAKMAVLVFLKHEHDINNIKY